MGIGLLFVVLCGWVGTNHLRNGETPSAVQAIQSLYANASLEDDASGGEVRPAVVHVAGQVRKPGLYELTTAHRVNDAIKKAGGPTASADLSRVNLAARLEDGAQVRVPAVGEKIAESATYLAPSGTRPTVATSRPSSRKETPAPGSISLNQAGLEELDRLPGVGPATAQKIIEHRNRIGRFTSVDQLLDVKGIGPKKMEAIRPFVTL